MQKHFRSLINFPFHPILVSLYVVISLFAINIDQIRVNAVFRSLWIVPLVAVFMMVILNTLLKNWQRSAALATIYLILFFSYGHIYHYFKANPILGWQLGRHRILIAIFITIAGLCTWLVLTKLKDLNNTTKLFNLISITLLLFPIIQIVIFNFRQQDLRKSNAFQASPIGSTQLSTPASPPDVYYIILDGYSRPDILKTDFNFDDSSFIAELQKLGFYIATCSQANYNQTSLSMASSLNLNYLDSLEQVDLSNNSSSVLYPWLDNNAVLNTFKQLGYSLVTFGTDYYWLNLKNVDKYYSPESKALNSGESRLKVNGFEAMLIRQSAGLLLTDLLSFLPDNLQPDLDYPDRSHREMVLYDFDQLNNIPLEIKSPKFVYAHIVAPHPPLVFGLNGEWVNLPENLDDAGWRKAYTDEIQYVNHRILQVVREIISISAVPPVIIIQADHGAMISDQENYPEILSAYYLPGDGSASLYPTITPVNTYRTIFNQYFGGTYLHLEDKTYISRYSSPFNFSQVPSSCP
jgi:hypothetical protein